MSVTTQNNVMQVMVAKDVDTTAFASITSDLTTLTEGQISVVGFNTTSGKEEKLGSTAPTASLYPYVRFVQNIGGEIFYSSKFYGKDITTFRAKAYAASQEQIWYLGFDGTTSSLDVTQSTEFIMTIAYDHDDMMWSQQKQRDAFDFYAAVPTQKALALSMASQINKKEYSGLINGTGRKIKAEILNTASSATSMGAITVDAINGSDIMKFSGSITGATVGNFIKSAGLSGGVTAAVPVYQILAVNNTASAVGALPAYSVQISMPFQGTTSLALSAAGTDFGYITSAGMGSDWGVKFTGLVLTWKKDFFKYNKVKFRLDLKGFGTTVINKSQESSKGNGTGYEVAEFESFASGNEGALNRTIVPLPTGRANAVSTTNYNIWAIEATDSQNNNPIYGTASMKKQIFLVFPDTTNGNKQQTGVNAGEGICGSNMLFLTWLNAFPNIQQTLGTLTTTIPV